MFTTLQQTELYMPTRSEEQYKADHDLLIKIDAKLSLFFDTLDDHIKDNNTRFTDIETRIRKLEYISYALFGIFTFINIISKFIK